MIAAQQQASKHWQWTNNVSQRHRRATSISEPCNVFDVELANIGHEAEGAQLQNTGPVKRNGGSCPNGEISHDQVPQVDEYGSSSSGKLSHVCAYCTN